MSVQVQPTMTDRWPNQQRAFAGAIDAINRGVKRLCITSPTGSGKTRMFTDMIEWSVENKHPVALYTQRRMLYDQTCRVLDKSGIRFGKRASGHECISRSRVDCTVPSLYWSMNVISTADQHSNGSSTITSKPVRPSSVTRPHRWTLKDTTNY